MSSAIKKLINNKNKNQIHMTNYRSFKRYSPNSIYSPKNMLKIGLVAITSFAIYEGCQLNKEITELRTQNYHVLNSKLEKIIKNYESP